ncbi:polymorphic toxin-type HINT domain-containing protein [Gimesia chilikensis]|uniref:polymorphic toxin-type HINT domain-containing protein n=1 Tax=Gimesia chilikensis TaxID=2605989 RepID=UPI001E40273D|nr:polymorphic toxin-type HINT domain-containing protein [Gimesia chilikensis]
MEQQPGKYVLGQLLRSTSWIRQNNALPGAVIQLEIPEMHVAGDAEVLSIADCPPIRRGPGSVVTGTFQHVSDEVISVFVEGESEPIGATSQHPFWSRDRNAFVPAGELRIGEELKTALGTSTRVTSIEIRAGPETVYGLEVAGEHVYQITHAGLLVHNASGKGRKTPIEELLQDVYDANSFKTITAGKHHLSPKAVANDLRYGHKSLTDLNSFKHTVLQGALDDFLLNKTKLLADGRVVHMKPQTGNSGRTVRANFTLQERIDALDEFYSSFVEGRYYPAFRMELNAAKKTGKLR